MRIYGLFILLVPSVPQSLNYIRVVQIVKCFRQTQLSVQCIFCISPYSCCNYQENFHEMGFYVIRIYSLVLLNPIMVRAYMSIVKAISSRRR